jgi:CheY-like chemotaxis protein
MTTRRVLLVEDHADSREVFMEILAMAGHIVKTAEDGVDALNLLSQEPFDVALIDIILPNLSGVEVARQTRERLGSQAPFLIALTAYVLPKTEDREQEKQNADDKKVFDVHLVKPIDPTALLDAIAQAPMC